MQNDYTLTPDERRVNLSDLLAEGRKIIPCDTLAKWLADVASGAWVWPRNSRCKYVTLKIDTRAGAFQVLDRDGNHLTADELLFQIGSHHEPE